MAKRGAIRLRSSWYKTDQVASGRRVGKEFKDSNQPRRRWVAKSNNDQMKTNKITMPRNLILVFDQILVFVQIRFGFPKSGRNAVKMDAKPYFCRMKWICLFVRFQIIDNWLEFRSEVRSKAETIDAWKTFHKIHIPPSNRQTGVPGLPSWSLHLGRDWFDMARKESQIRTQNRLRFDWRSNRSTWIIEGQRLRTFLLSWNVAQTHTRIHIGAWKRRRTAGRHEICSSLTAFLNYSQLSWDLCVWERDEEREGRGLCTFDHFCCRFGEEAGKFWPKKSWSTDSQWLWNGA